MKKLLLVVIALAAIGYLVYQKHPGRNPLVGEWVLDFDAMNKAFTAAGWSEAELDNFRAKNSNGSTSLSISSGNIIFNVENDTFSAPYEIVSTTGNCSDLKLEPSGKVSTFCLSDDVLTITNNRGAIPQVFDRK